MIAHHLESGVQMVGKPVSVMTFTSPASSTLPLSSISFTFCSALQAFSPISAHSTSHIPPSGGLTCDIILSTLFFLEQLSSSFSCWMSLCLLSLENCSLTSQVFTIDDIWYSIQPKLIDTVLQLLWCFSPYLPFKL